MFSHNTVGYPRQEVSSYWDASNWLQDKFDHCPCICNINPMLHCGIYYCDRFSLIKELTPAKSHLPFPLVDLLLFLLSQSRLNSSADLTLIRFNSPFAYLGGHKFAFRVQDLNFRLKAKVWLFHPFEQCTGWSNWILPRKLKYYTCCLRDIFLF